MNELKSDTGFTDVTLDTIHIGFICLWDLLTVKKDLANHLIP